MRLWLLGLTAFAAPLGSVHAAVTCPGDAGYTLAVNDPVPVSGSFMLELSAAPGDLAFLFISAHPGPLASPIGTLCFGLPLYSISTVPLPGGSLLAPHFMGCNSGYAGIVGYAQFVAVNGANPGVFHKSNGVSFSIIDAACTGLVPGDFFTYTQGGWGTSCNGNNPGCLRDKHFDAVFPDGLVLGDPDGVDGDGAFAVHLTSSAAVEALLPTGGKAGKLTGDLTNPTSTPAGVFAGQLASCKLSVQFDLAGVFDAVKGLPGVQLGNLEFVGQVHPKLIGKSVDEVIALSDLAISGAAMPLDVDGDLVGDVGYSDLSSALDKVNNNFDNGTVNNGVLALP